MKGEIFLKDVRISFPALFKPAVFNGVTGKFGAKFIIDPSSASGGKQLKKLKKLVREASMKAFGTELAGDKLFLRDGDLTGREECAEKWVVSANNKTRPYILCAEGTSIVKEEFESDIYAGCYVNAKIAMWIQDNKFGKKINCNLVAVQFARDGDRFGGVSEEDAISGF